MRIRPETKRSAMVFCFRAVAICVLIGARAAMAQSITRQTFEPNNVRERITPINRLITVSPLTSRGMVTMPPISAEKDETRHTGRNVAIGALIGGVVLGGLELNNARHCTDCYFTGPAVIAAVGVGAVGGAFIGWIASNIR